MKIVGKGITTAVLTLLMPLGWAQEANDQQTTTARAPSRRSSSPPRSGNHHRVPQQHLGELDQR